MVIAYRGDDGAVVVEVPHGPRLAGENEAEHAARHAPRDREFVLVRRSDLPPRSQRQAWTLTPRGVEVRP